MKGERRVINRARTSDVRFWGIQEGEKKATKARRWYSLIKRRNNRGRHKIWSPIKSTGQTLKAGLLTKSKKRSRTACFCGK